MLSDSAARFTSPPKLAEAQYLIARELRFDTWAALKRHTAGMARGAPRDGWRGARWRSSDVARSLRSRPAGGFAGSRLQRRLPCGHLSLSVRPGARGLGQLEQRARHIVDCYSDEFDPPLDYEGQLRALEDQDRALETWADYERVVLWFEHDGVDQLSLIHLLGVEGASASLLRRAPGLDREGRAQPPWTDVLVITELGRAVLRGEVDFRALDPPPRWVGGVEIAAARRIGAGTTGAATPCAGGRPTPPLPTARHDPSHWAAAVDRRGPLH